jgi:adenylate kinase
MELDDNGVLSASLPRHIVWLSGAPGSGKGTHTPAIIDFFQLHKEPLIASSMLNTPEMRDRINQGLLLDYQTVITAVFQNLQKPMFQRGVLVDGFPRSHGQSFAIEWLQKKMIDIGRQPQFVSIVFTVSSETSVARQLERGQRAVMSNENVQNSGVGTLQEVRSTDLDQNIARKRYDVFMQETYAAVHELDGKIPFISINADRTLDTVAADLLSKLQQIKARYYV